MTTPVAASVNNDSNEMMVDDDDDTELVDDDDTLEVQQQQQQQDADDKSQVSSGSNAQQQEQERDDEMEQDSKYSKAMYLSTRSGLDPPLVAATLILRSAESEDDEEQQQHAGSGRTIVQAVAVSVDELAPVAVTAELEEEDSEEAVPIESSQPSPSQHQQERGQQQRPASGRVEAVHIDEVPPSASFLEEDKKQSFCRRRWVLTLCLIGCGILGIAIGIAVALTRSRNNSNNDTNTNNFAAPAPVSLAPTTNAPSMSPQPTFSPSCANTWQATRQRDFFNADSNEEQQNIRHAVSPDGSTAIISYTEPNQNTLQGFTDPDDAFALTLNLEAIARDNNIATSIQRHDKFVIQDMAFSMDGSRILVAVSNTLRSNFIGSWITDDDDDAGGNIDTEIGGGFWIFQRIERFADARLVWLPLYFHFSGGGLNGVVFAVASGGDGNVHAMVAGSFDDNIPAHIQVYRQETVGSGNELYETTELLPVGQRLVENALNDKTRIALSASGERLAVYTNDGRVRVFDYVQNQEMWDVVAEMDNPVEAGTLALSKDGRVAALFDMGEPTHVLQYSPTTKAWKTHLIATTDPLSYGSMSVDGRTIVTVTTISEDFNVAHIHQQPEKDGDWVEVESMVLDQLPSGGADQKTLMGVSMDESGRKLVLIGIQTLYIYERVCIPSNGGGTPPPSPSPTIASSTCIDAFAPFELLHNVTDGEEILFDDDKVSSNETTPSVKPDLNGTGIVEAPIDNTTSSVVNNARTLQEAMPGDESRLELIREALFNALNTTSAFNETEINEILDQVDILIVFADIPFEEVSDSELLDILFEFISNTGESNNDDVPTFEPEPNGFGLSADGSVAFIHGIGAGVEGIFDFVDIYDLKNASAPKQRLLFPDIIQDVAISGNGQRMVLGAVLVSVGVSMVIPFQPGGVFTIYRLGTSPTGQAEWIYELDVKTGGGENSAVRHVAISYEGNTMAFVSGGAFNDGASFFVAAYTFIQGGGFVLLGNTLREDWMNFDTKVRVVDKRLFVSSFGGVTRTYDLVDNAWQRVGQKIVHDTYMELIAPLNDAIFGTAQPYDTVNINEYQFPFWLPVDTNSLHAYIGSGAPIIDVIISPDGNEIALIEFNQDLSDQGLRYNAQLYRRGGSNNGYEFRQTIVMDFPGYPIAVQLTISGDIIVLTSERVLIYRRTSCDGFYNNGN
jgi:hypothetical protein